MDKAKSTKVDNSAEEEVAARDKAVADRIERKEAELVEQEKEREARLERKGVEVEVEVVEDEDAV